MYQFDEFAKTHLGWTGYGNNVNIKVLCIWHDDSSPSMSFHRDTGQYFCFSCSAKGGMFSLARKLGLVVMQNGFIPELDNPAEEMASFIRSLDQLDHAEDVPDYMPETSLRQFQRVRNPYWQRRGFTDETVKAWELGFDKFRNAMTIPIRAPFTDRLIGVTRRQLDPAAKPKYLDPKHFNKAKSLFGSWMDMHRDKENPKRVILGEGPPDAMKPWQAGYNGRAILGANITRDQVNILRRYGVETVVLFFDNDKYGFKVAMSAMGRLRRDFDVLAAVYSDKYKAKDPGGLRDHQIVEAIENAIPLNELILG